MHGRIGIWKVDKQIRRNDVIGGIPKAVCTTRASLVALSRFPSSSDQPCSAACKRNSPFHTLSFTFRNMPRLSRPRKRASSRRDDKTESSVSCGESGSKPQKNGFFSAISMGDFDFKRPKVPWPQSLWVVLSPLGHPNKRRLMTVQDFFKYTEEEGRKFFEELDSDGDGKVSLEDMKVAMRKRKLPEKYANEFVNRARGGKWWQKSLDWEEFKMVVDERESEMLRAYTTLEMDAKGTVKLTGIKDSLKKLGLPATDENAKAMLKSLDTEEDGFVSYGKFRNFAILLPRHKLQESMDPSVAWFESSTMVPIGPPMETEARDDTGKMLLTAALAGGLASGLSTFLMHPVDTLKTRVQSSIGVSALDVVRSVRKIGPVGLYRGVLPATCGSGVSHGLRTCAYEGSLKILTAITGGAAELQVQGLASGVGTFLGTALRIPCEVLKQRLQVGQHDNVQQAFSVAVKTDGPRGLFRGTAATLSREVPFYMFGMMFYQVLKKVFRGELFGRPGRDLKPWETIMVGALSGACGAIATTPADVMKTRIMTASAGTQISASQILIDMLKAEGLPALFKGALPRAVWIAPLGAMNFAGYELAKNALAEKKQQQQVEKRTGEQEPELPEAVPSLEVAEKPKQKAFWQRESTPKPEPAVEQPESLERDSELQTEVVSCSVPAPTVTDSVNEVDNTESQTSTSGQAAVEAAQKLPDQPTSQSVAPVEAAGKFPVTDMAAVENLSQTETDLAKEAAGKLPPGLGGGDRPDGCAELYEKKEE